MNSDGSENGKNGIEASCSSSSNYGVIVGVDECNLELLVYKGFEHVNGNHGKQRISLLIQESLKSHLCLLEVHLWMLVIISM